MMQPPEESEIFMRVLWVENPDKIQTLHRLLTNLGVEYKYAGHVGVQDV
jgi:hypothetical protein